MLKNRDAIDIAINGSQQFHQKSASAGDNVTLDPPLGSHAAISDMLIKSAEWLEQQEPKNTNALFLRAAADRVRIGVPAKIAMYAVTGGNKEIAAPLFALADAIGDDVLGDYIIATYQQKVAEWKEKKRARGKTGNRAPARA
jgi:hypothetical protein